MGAPDVPSRIGDSRDGRGWGPTPSRPDGRRGSGPEGEPNRPTVPPPRRWRKKANYRTTRKRGSRTRRHAGGTRLKGARVGNAGESPAPADRGGRTRPTQVGRSPPPPSTSATPGGNPGKARRTLDWRWKPAESRRRSRGPRTTSPGRCTTRVPGGGFTFLSGRSAVSPADEIRLLVARKGRVTPRVVLGVGQFRDGLALVPEMGVQRVVEALQQ